MGDQQYPVTRKHEKWAYNKGFFSAINRALKSKLSKAQLEMLNLCESDRTYTIADQLFLRYIDNRYFTLLTKQEILKNVRDCIETYKFLLDSNLEPKKIRYAFSKALMDVISMGSGSYFLWWDAWYDKFWKRGRYWTTKREKQIAKLLLYTPKRRRLWNRFRIQLEDIFRVVGEKYPNLPVTPQFVQWYDDRREEDPPPVTWFLWQHLLISYAYPIHLLMKSKQWNMEEFRVDFFQRHRWCLERLSRCNHIFINKYKEKICEDLSHYLGKDPDIAHNFCKFPLWDKLDVSPNFDFVSKIKNLILGCFSSEELALFIERDEGGNEWDLGTQIQDRYYSKHPSLASGEEIEKCVREIVEEYRPLLCVENIEVMREIILDEIERVAFVSKFTHLWNLEMEKNLKNVQVESIDKEVVGVIDFLVSQLPRGCADYFSTDVDGKSFSLREQLLARWSRSLFASNIKKFQQYLSMLHLYTPNSPSNWGDTPSRIDLQAFLGEIDMFFLYPRKGRKLKKFFSRLDTGRVAGGRKAIGRVYISFMPPNDVLTRRVGGTVACTIGMILAVGIPILPYLWFLVV